MDDHSSPEGASHVEKSKFLDIDKKSDRPLEIT